jgi:ribulose-phosphate 3-epimerase
MAATICPTITARDAAEYSFQMDRITKFAGRIHIDVADGVLAPRQLTPLDELWWPGNVAVDIHVMYKDPAQHLELFVAQHPQLLIIHAEAAGDFNAFADALHAHGIQVGVALLPDTPADLIVSALPKIDHVLIFSGNLGYQGGSAADVSLLEKARQLRAVKPTIELGWDGGINDQNAKVLIDGGIDVLNVGGFIQHASNPEAAYATLKAITQTD